MTIGLEEIQLNFQKTKDTSLLSKIFNKSATTQKTVLNPLKSQLDVQCSHNSSVLTTAGLLFTAELFIIRVADAMLAYETCAD